MGFGLPNIENGTKALRRTLSGVKEAASKSSTIPKGYIVVYVGEYEKNRFEVPLAVLNCIPTTSQHDRGRVRICASNRSTYISLQRRYLR